MTRSLFGHSARTRSVSRNSHMAREGQKGIAMRRFASVAALAAAFTFTATPAFAQTAPAASASGGVSLGTPPSTPPSATPAPTTAPAPAPASPLYCTTTTECLKAYPFIVNWLGVNYKGFALGAQEEMDKTKAAVSAEDAKKVQQFIGNLPTGVKEAMELFGYQAMPTKKWDDYLAAHNCTKTQEEVSTDTEFTAEAWSDNGCATLDGQIKPLVVAAIAKTTDPTARAIAGFLNGKADQLEEAAKQGTTGNSDLKIILRHFALLATPVENWGVTDDLTTASAAGGVNPLMGHHGCIIRKGKDPKCGEIKAVDAAGVTIDDEMVPFTDILDGSAGFFIGDEALISSIASATNSWSRQNPLRFGVRGFYRDGKADGYHDPSMVGAMLTLEYRLTDNIGLHGGVGAAQLRGQSILGTDKKASDKVAAAMVGGTVLLGSRDWVAAPVLELNLAFQGHGLGGEGALGVEILPKGPINGRIMGTYGVYNTGQVTHTNTYGRDTKAFNLAGGGVIFGVGGNL